MIEAFRHVGTVACVRERLKILVRIPAIWSAQSLITAPGIPSGVFSHLVLLERERWGAGTRGRQ